jgi:hypothetical protein
MARTCIAGRSLRMVLLLACFGIRLVAGQDDAATSEDDQIELELRNVISSWASAWQSQLDDIYLLHYHPDFQPEAGITREAWEDTRRSRILDPEYIRITLREFSLLEIGPSSAVVNFTLNYTSPGYADRTRKQIELGLNAQLWQILRETNLNVQHLPAPTE